MKSKTLGLLAGITILGMVMAIFLNREPAASLPKSGELLFPQLLSVVNDVNQVEIATKEQTMTLVRGKQTWEVKEKAGYRADMEKVKKALVGLAELRIHEPKTKNPELYDRLGLQDIDQEGSTATHITLKTANNPQTAVVLVGNQRPAKGNPRMSDIYVRQPGDPQIWLVVGNLPLEKIPGEWLDKEITALTTKRVQQVTVTHPSGETLHLSKEKPEDLDFQFDSIPNGYKVSSPFNVNNVVGSLVQLSLEDVKTEAEAGFQANSGVTAVLETFDGLRLHVETAKHDDKIFGKFSAEFDQKLVQQIETSKDSEETPDETIDQTEGDKKEEVGTGEQAEVTKSELTKKESILKKPEEVKKEVEEINQRVQGWVYELPKFRVENFSKLKKDLIAKES